MNKRKTLLIVTLAIGLVTVFAGSELAAGPWYVDSTASEDTGSGTSSGPYATLYEVFDDGNFEADGVVMISREPATSHGASASFGDSPSDYGFVVRRRR